MKAYAMTGPAAQPRDVISFGPFSMVAGERQLLKDGVPVALGARTFDTLVALVNRPNRIVSKRDLMAEIWPGVIVDEGSLRVTITALRKALGDGQDGARYITTVAGRGYGFVAPISRSGERAAVVSAPLPDIHFLPSRLQRMVGRADGVLALSTELAAARFVTIVGPGGVGKTTVAVAVAHDMMDAFGGSVLFVDLSMLSDPDMVPMSLASMLGLSVQAGDPTRSLIAYLRDKRILLILDNCEHVIEAAANLAALIFMAASQLHILATSREALRVEGEHVHKLNSLACPPDDPVLTAATARTFPAIQLFMERAAASGAQLDLSDSDAAIVASICRKLDGVPLAIELAAGRVEAYGLRQTAALLDQRLALLWRGRRTAPPRQQTLRATLDWSHALLSDLERTVLRRLAVFVGSFTIEAALKVVTSGTVVEDLVFDAIDSLVAKSMVATHPVGAMMRYRLLETMRAFVLETGIDAEVADVSARHAIYYRGWLEVDGAKWPTLSNPAERAPHLANLGNVRAALEWCFGPDDNSEPGGNTEIGVGLAAAAGLVFWAMSLPAECHHWSERAILALDDATLGGREEMLLQAALAVSLIYSRGLNDAASRAVDRSLAIAEAQGDALDQLLPLHPLQAFHLYVGDCGTSLHYATRACAVAKTTNDPAAIAFARTLLGISLHYSGDLDAARLEFEAAVRVGPAPLVTAGKTYLNNGHQISASVTLARNLWLQGYPAQALERSRQTVKEAASMDIPVPLAAALTLSITVFLWAGALESAKEFNEWYIAVAQAHALRLEIAMAGGLAGQIAVLEGDATGGIEMQLSCIEELRAARFGLSVNSFTIPLVEALAAVGRFGEGLEMIDETIREVESGRNFLNMPELLRVKGKLLLSMPQPNRDEAETCFMQSLDVSRGQGARAWELRTATSLAELWLRQGKAGAARDLLAPVYARFTEGFDTGDLMAAKRLLDELG